MNRRVLIALNTAWNLVNFRAGLIKALVSEGYEVVAVAPEDEYASRLAALGCRFVPLPIDNGGTHVGRDLLLLVRYYRLFRQERPSVYLGYTAKPNIFGSFAARALGIPVINNIAGLGVVFTRKNWLSRLVGFLYRMALSRSHKIFFQNEEDRRRFIDAHFVRENLTARLPGSGIDVSRFDVRTRKHSNESFVFLLCARLLWEKGVGEFVEAARRLRREFPHAEFRLLGFLDVQNPSSISREQVKLWEAEGTVRYLGSTDDVAAVYADADCIVLPSYYPEGVPRSLLEAASMGLPLITTNTPGCRDAVADGESGYLCRPRDVEDLASKMRMMLLLRPEERTDMGRRGREKMIREFDERIVISRYLETIKEAVNR